jgi:hypothetical protein
MRSWVQSSGLLQEVDRSWFGYKMLPTNSWAIVVIGEVWGYWLDYEGSNFIIAEWTTRKWLLVGGSRLLGVCPWRIYFVLGPWCSLFYFCGHHEVSSFPPRHAPTIMMFLPWHRSNSNAASQLWTETSENCEPELTFPPVSWFSQVIGHSNKMLTY